MIPLLYNSKIVMTIQGYINNKSKDMKALKDKEGFVAGA
jgi:hypothetical protein